jgi:hypothetical protein
MKVLFPDGTSILAHGRLDVVPPERPRAPDAALYLDARWTTDPGVTWPFTFVPWEDFALPDDEEALFRALDDAWAAARSGKLVEIACDGGTGRTGTALACLAVLAGVELGSAVAWVRTNYHPWAVEVPEQEALVGRFAAWVQDTAST